MRAISKDLAELDARIERLRERIKASDLDLTAFGRALAEGDRPLDLRIANAAGSRIGPFLLCRLNCKPLI